MQHLRDESISAVSMLACEHGGEGSMLSCPSGLMARWGLFIWKRECMQITVMPRGWGWGWGGYLTSYFTKIMWPLWSRVAGKLSLNSTFWRGHFLFSHMTVTYRHTWIFIVSLRGLNETKVKLKKVRFRAFKVFLVLTNMGYYGGSTGTGADTASQLDGKLNILNTQRSFCTKAAACVTALKDCVILISCVSAAHTLFAALYIESD